MTDRDTQHLLSVHHIGGRAGTSGLDIPPLLRSGMAMTMYDADPSCVDEAAKEVSALGYGKSCVLPYCVSDRDAVGPFHIYADPNASSAYLPNKRYDNYFYQGRGFDFEGREISVITETINPQFVTLDSLCFGQTEAVLPPQLLSLDAQGSEYDILVGAKKCLDQHVLGLITETELVERYEKGRVFGDIHTFLLKQGFEFMGFRDFMNWGALRTPVGLRSLNLNAVGTAVFLRAPDTLPNGPGRRLALKQLAFIAVLVGQVEFAVSCLSHLGAEPDAQGPTQPSYLRFIDEFHEAAQKMPATFLPGCSSFFKRTSRACGASSSSFFSRNIRPLVNQNPRIEQLYIACREAAERVKKGLRVATAPATPVEIILEAYGLSRQAARLREVRVGFPN
jgi:FkbM family methyltransferase